MLQSCRKNIQGSKTDTSDEVINQADLYFLSPQEEAGLQE